ncbi:DUF563 domain-containing protein [Beijerinckia sp. L45]|uniref:glycosyltransferase family 61 protein n=1 Tax=Beijerinckia sp. L45 TaxID=1641855 RepID=UPI00131AE083|nr:glycosyltransferase family 61 protein [Beijerinckia sp. L45]
MRTPTLWRRWFENITVVYLVSESQKDDLTLETDSKIKIEYGDCGSIEFLVKMATKYSPDLIVDDGLHIPKDQIIGFMILFQSLVSGGIYIVEDMHTNVPPLSQQYIPDGHESFLGFVVRILGYLSHGQNNNLFDSQQLVCIPSKFVESVTFYDKLCAITRSGYLTMALVDARSTSAKFTEVNNGGSYSRIEPLIYNAPQSVLDAIDGEEQRGEIAPPPAFVAEFDDAFVRGPGYITIGNAIISDCLINLMGSSNLRDCFDIQYNLNNELIASIEFNSAKQVLNGEFVLLKQNADVNYGHWLIEGLTRMQLLEGYDISSLQFILNGDASESLKQIYVDGLALLGVRKEQILFLGSEIVQAKKLIYPSPITIQPWVKAPICMPFLRKFTEFDETKYGDAPKLIYVTRASIGRRNLTNEAEIIETVQNYGFIVIKPESLCFYDQIKIFSKAEIVIGNLGGGLSNIVFCPDGLTLLALTTQYMLDDFFWDIVSQKNGKYLSLHGRAVEPSLGMQSDFMVDHDEFVGIFAKIMAGRTPASCP